MIDKLKYQEITSEDEEQVVQLYSKYLNSGNYIAKHVHSEILSPEFVGFKVVDGERIVGIVSGVKGIVFTYPHEDLEEEIKSKYTDRIIYTVDSMIVEEEYRHYGIATELGHYFVKELYNRGVDIMLTELWIKPDGSIPAMSVVACWKNCIEQRDIPMFYENLDKFEMECPICGSRCICGARIRLIKVDDITQIQCEEEDENSEWQKK